MQTLTLTLSVNGPLFSVFRFRHHKHNIEVEVNVDVDANAKVSCEQDWTNLDECFCSVINVHVERDILVHIAFRP